MNIYTAFFLACTQQDIFSTFFCGLSQMEHVHNSFLCGLYQMEHPRSFLCSLYQTEHFHSSGLVQKDPLRIHKLFHKTWHDACNMAQKSNTKVCNSSAHPVKGRNPYWSQCTTPVKTDRKCFFVISHSNLFLSTVWSWGMQFLTDKLICPECYEDHKIPKLSQIPLSFPKLSRP